MLTYLNRDHSKKRKNEVKKKEGENPIPIKNRHCGFLA